MKRIILVIAILALATVVFAGSYTPGLNLYKPSPKENNWGDVVNINNWDKLDSVYSSMSNTVMKLRSGTYYSGEFASLNAAVSALSSTNATLVVNSSLPLTSVLFVPSNISVVITKSGMITKSSGTVSFDGPFPTGRHQVFSGFSAGDVTFGSGSVKEVYPEWWGAKGDGVTDSTTAINAAQKTAELSKVPLKFSTGTYIGNLVLNAVRSYDPVLPYYVIEGSGMGLTILKSPNNLPIISDNTTTINTGYLWVKINDLSLMGSGTGTAPGIKFTSMVFDSVFENIFTKTDGPSFWFTDDNGMGGDHSFANTFKNLYISSITDHGMIFKNADRFSFYDLYLQWMPIGTGKAGIRIYNSWAMFKNLSAVNSGDYVAILGATQAEDGFTGRAVASFENSNFESASYIALYAKSDYAFSPGTIWIKNSNFYSAASYSYDIKTNFSGYGTAYDQAMIILDSVNFFDGPGNNATGAHIYSPDKSINFVNSITVGMTSDGSTLTEVRTRNTNGEISAHFRLYYDGANAYLDSHSLFTYAWEPLTIRASEIKLTPYGNQVARITNSSILMDGVISESVGSNIASAATLTTTLGKQIFHVTGTTTINTITLPDSAFKGSIKIIPDGVFSTGTSGNIAISSTAVVGKVLIMTYDGTKWYPSY